MQDIKQPLRHLNRLAPCYHSGLGFKKDADQPDQTVCVFGQDSIKNWWLKNGGTDPEDDDEIHIPVTKLIDMSKQEIGQTTVVIKFSTNWDKLPPTQWYNLPPTAYMKMSPEYESQRLPFLNTRSYVTVDDPFMQVTVSAKQKGKKITFDDILFATRALAMDDTRTVDYYKSLAKTKAKWVLEPEMDNFST